MPLTHERRAHIIGRLIDNEVDNVTQFALRDLESLREYVRAAAHFEALDDDTLQGLYDQAFQDMDKPMRLVPHTPELPAQEDC